MQLITSKDNEIVKHIKKLSDKKYRDQNNCYIVEGIKLVEEAIKEEAQIEKIIICEESTKTSEISKSLMYEIAKHDCIYVTEKIFKSLTQVMNPQGILAVIKKNQERSLIKYDEDIIVALDDIQDPGNLGTILRTVDSVGLKQLIVSKGTADVYNPKVVRSSMGAIFRVEVIEVEDLKETIKMIKRNNYDLLVTSLQTNSSIYEINYNKKVIVIGNEANGVSKEIQDMADLKAKIPMIGTTESLNVSVATGIILYEYVRQKLTK